MGIATTGGKLNSLRLFAILFLFWLLLNGNLAFDTLLIGALVALVITYFFSDGLSFLSDFRFTPQAVVATFQYFGYFFKELIKSNIKLAAIVIDPALPINPGIVKVHTNLKTKMGRLLLANSITLTPGTLTVEMEGEWLYVHWVNMDTADTEQATKTIAAGFEKYLGVMYG